VTDDLASALQMADAADQITMERFGALDLRVDTKPDLTPVSDADQAAERCLRDMIADQHPADGILGEEFGAELAGLRNWVIDPIDGTKNYVRGVPVWATIIALVTGDDITDSAAISLGVVSAPALGRRWWASRGHGAWMTSGGAPRRLTASGVNELSDASVSFSEWNDPAWDRDGCRASFEALIRNVWRSRAYGDFWSHVMVAEGIVDAAVEPELAAWDMAALVPIVEEAGGTITSLDGRSPMLGGNALSSNGRLHPALLDAFNNA
jgi:histidinol-phosphatase